MQGVGGFYITKKKRRTNPPPQVFTLLIIFIFFIGDASFIFRGIKIDYFEKKSSLTPTHRSCRPPPPQRSRGVIIGKGGG